MRLVGCILCTIYVFVKTYKARGRERAGERRGERANPRFRKEGQQRVELIVSPRTPSLSSTHSQALTLKHSLSSIPCHSTPHYQALTIYSSLTIHQSPLMSIHPTYMHIHTYKASVRIPHSVRVHLYYSDRHAGTGRHKHAQTGTDRQTCTENHRQAHGQNSTIEHRRAPTGTENAQA